MRASCLLILAAALVVGCGRGRQSQVLSGDTMGTTYSLQLVGHAGKNALPTGSIEATLNEIEATFSSYKPDSEISRFNASRTTDWFSVSQSVCELVERSQTLSARSDGAFDITVAPLVNAWGFGTDFDVREIPSTTKVQRLLDEVGHELLQTDCDKPAIRKSLVGLSIDLSGIAKGYAVDALAGILEQRGIDRYLVEIGGEIRARGTNASGQPWAVAIEHPLTPGERPPLVVHLHDGAVATSGDYRNFVEVDGRRYSHTIDPRSGYPVAHALTAVTVVSDTAAMADALATALLVLGPDEGFEFAERASVAAAFLIREGDDELAIRRSTAFDARAVDKAR